MCNWKYYVLLYLRQNTVRCHHSAVSLLQTFSQQAHHGSPSRARYGGVFCELKVWFHIPYQLPQFCIQSEVYIPPRYDGTPLCVQIVPPLRGRSSCSRQEREICTDNITDGMQRNIIKSENVSPWLCRLKIYYVSLINFVASNPAISCICRTLPVYIITDASL